MAHAQRHVEKAALRVGTVLVVLVAAGACSKTIVKYLPATTTTPAHRQSTATSTTFAVTSSTSPSDDQQAASLLHRALSDELAAVQPAETDPNSGHDDGWYRSLEMSQLRGKTYFVEDEAPLGGGTVSVVVTGNPQDHPDDILLLGVRVGTTDQCFYARDVIPRASASITPRLVYAAQACVPPAQVPEGAWQLVSSPLALAG